MVSCEVLLIKQESIPATGCSPNFLLSAKKEIVLATEMCYNFI